MMVNQALGLVEMADQETLTLAETMEHAQMMKVSLVTELTTEDVRMLTLMVIHALIGQYQTMAYHIHIQDSMATTAETLMENLKFGVSQQTQIKCGDSVSLAKKITLVVMELIQETVETVETAQTAEMVETAQTVETAETAETMVVMEEMAEHAMKAIPVMEVTTEAAKQ